MAIGDQRRALKAKILELQEGKCAICGKSDKLSYVLDHDHHTGRVRGVLCNGCNVGLGRRGDTIERLRAFMAYLDREQYPIRYDSVSDHDVAFPTGAGYPADTSLAPVIRSLDEVIERLLSDW